MKLWALSVFIENVTYSHLHNDGLHFLAYARRLNMWQRAGASLSGSHRLAHLPRLVVFGVVMQYVPADADLVSSVDDIGNTLTSRVTWWSETMAKQLPEPEWYAVFFAKVASQVVNPMSGEQAERLSSAGDIITGAFKDTPLAISKISALTEAVDFNVILQADVAAIQELKKVFANVAADHPHAEFLKGFERVIAGSDPQVFTPSLRQQYRALDNPEILSMHFPARQRLFPTVPVPRLLPQTDVQHPPDSPRDICVDVVFDVLIPGFIRHVMEFLYECRDKSPGEATRKSNLVLAIHQDLFREHRRGRIYDMRLWKPDPITKKGPGIVLLDYEPWLKTGDSHIQTHLDISYIIHMLGPDFTDQQLLQFLSTGVQLVYTPQLSLEICSVSALVVALQWLSFSASRDSEIVSMGWYEVCLDIPFFPIRCHGQGSVPRNLKSNWRRISHYGGGGLPLYTVHALTSFKKQPKGPPVFTVAT